MTDRIREIAQNQIAIATRGIELIDLGTMKTYEWIRGEKTETTGDTRAQYVQAINDWRAVVAGEPNPAFRRNSPDNAN